MAPAAREALAELLLTQHMAVDLDFPGLRLVHQDPPVFTIDEFASRAECDGLAEAALATGRMERSLIGSGNASGDDGASYSGVRRTSTSVLLTPLLLAGHPQLATLVVALQDKIQTLLPVVKKIRGRGKLVHASHPWTGPGKLPPVGRRCFESPQVARYEGGQHFLEHEDGFPRAMLPRLQFQRHGTLLLYLNDVHQGGATHFTHLGLSVQPRAGKALLFFPSLADGAPDARTLHAAQDAQDLKVVFQQWVVCGADAATQRR